MQVAGKSAGSVAQDDMEQDDPLQAVVLCDVFNQRYAPLTLDMPRCLMPVCNVPMIEWTLESLAIAGVQEVIFLATWHAAQVSEYLATHHPASWRPTQSGRGGAIGGATQQMRTTLLAVPEARSVGDAMRELDSHQLVKSDFLLVHPDAVGNMDLAAVVKAHKQRRRVDRDAIMTICTMPCEYASRARRYGDLSVFALAPQTAQLLHYAAVPAVPRKSLLKLPLEMFEEVTKNSGGKGAEVDVRNDLIDCGVDVCSIDVPPLFTENFDYQALRRDYVHGILTSDLLEAKIFVHVAPPANSSSTSSGEPWSSSAGGMLGSPTYGAGYMLRASDPAGYDALTQDIISGWTYPYTPRHLLPSGAKYTQLRGLRFQGEGSVVDKNARVRHRTVIGARARIASSADVVRSVLGANVEVGPRSVISASYVWAGARIGAGCTIDKCILGYGATILDNVQLKPGTIIGNGCVVGPGVSLPPAARVSRHAYRPTEEEDTDFSGDADADESQDMTPPPATSEQLGAGGKGHLWPALDRADAEDVEDDDDLDDIEKPANARLFQLDPDYSTVYLSDDMSSLSSVDADSDPMSDDDDNDSDFDDDDDDAGDELSGSLNGSMSLTLPSGRDSQTLTEKLESEQRLRDFQAEAKASLERAFEEGHEADNAAIELKTLRMASNVPPGEVRKVVIAHTLSHCSVDQAKETAELLDRWGPLIREVSQDDQVEALAVMQSYCALHVSHTRLFVPLLKKVFNDEIVSDDAILAWWKSPKSCKLVLDASTGKPGNTSPEQLVIELRNRAEPVVRYILEDDDDDDDDDDDEEESE